MRALGGAALKLIEAQPIVAGNPHVFPGEAGEGRHFVGITRVLEGLCAAADLQGVTCHTLRHTFASFAGELGFLELTVAALLGHASRGVTQRYVHIDKAVQLAANDVASTLERLLGGKNAMGGQ